MGLTQQLEIRTNHVLGLLLAVFTCQGIAATSADLTMQVETYVRALINEAHPDAISVSIDIKPPDPRISLDACLAPDISVHGDNRLRSRILVRLDCEQNKSLYLAVNIGVFKPVLVSAAALARRTLISADDVILKHIDIMSNHRPLLTSKAQAIGKQLKRSVPAGMLLTTGMLVEPTLVNRGDSVVIVARRGALMVRSQGTALASGGLNEQIPVRNDASGRAVKGWIRSAGEIHVPF